MYYTVIKEEADNIHCRDYTCQQEVYDNF